MKRAASGVPMCIREGTRRRGRDRTHLYRCAAGSAAELRDALEIATAWGYVDEAKVKEVDAIADRIMLWRLTR